MWKWLLGSFVSILVFAGCESPADVTATAKIKAQGTALAASIRMDLSTFKTDYEVLADTCGMIKRMVARGDLSPRDMNMFEVVYDMLWLVRDNPITAFLYERQKQQLYQVQSSMYEDAERAGRRGTEVLPHCAELLRARSGIQRTLEEKAKAELR